MKFARSRAAGALCAILALPAALAAAAVERTAPPRPPNASSGAAASEKQAIVSRVLEQDPVKAAVAGHRTKVLRVWTEEAKADGVPRRRSVVLIRDYETGTAREIALDLATGRIEMREVAGVQPSEEEMEQAAALIRRDPAFAALVANPRLELIGGFHNRSAFADDPCARDVCVEFAFMKPNYEGPERYVVVDLTRGIVAHHDFRPRPDEPRPRMTERRGP
jgi:hypothetical protein